MDRLTEHYGKYIRVKGCTSVYANEERKGANTCNAIVRLAAYEDTDLMPDEIPHWIPVEERLPEEHEIEEDIYDPESLATVDTDRNKGSDLVNVVVIDNETDKRFVCDDVTINGKWVNFPDYRYTVTHWMPLPSAPKGEK